MVFIYTENSYLKPFYMNHLPNITFTIPLTLITNKKETFQKYFWKYVSLKG